MLQTGTTGGEGTSAHERAGASGMPAAGSDQVTTGPATATTVLAVDGGAVGLCAGSVLNVVIRQVPARGRWSPLPRCPTCSSPGRRARQRPAPSWVVGRYRACGPYVPAHYPVVETATARLLVAAAPRCGPLVVGELQPVPPATGSSLTELDLLTTSVFTQQAKD